MNFKKNKNYRELNRIYKSEKNSKIYKIYKFLSTIYFRIFKNNKIYNFVYQKNALFV